MKKIITLIFLQLFLITSSIYANSGFFVTGGGLITYNLGSSDINSYAALSSGNADLGSVTLFTFKGGYINTWKDASGNVCSGTLYYRIYKQGSTAPGFTNLPLSWEANGPSNTLTAIPSNVTLNTSTDQRWKNTGQNINVLTIANTSGIWILEVYWAYSGSVSSNSSCANTYNLDNSGNYYKWTFSNGKIALPTITSTSSSITSNNSQTYKGATITINGTNLSSINSVKIGGSGGVACTNVTVVSATQVTAVVPNGTQGGTIWISDGTNNATSSDSYTNLGFISTTTGNWTTGSTWLGGTAPSTTDKATIANSHTVTLDATSTIAQLTINSGGTYAGSSNTLTIAASGTLTNNGTFTAGTGTVIFAGAGTISGTIAFNNLTLNGNVSFSNATTVNGTLLLNPGYTVSTNSPIYGASSKLVYNSGGTPDIVNSKEWTAASGTLGTTAGYPNNIDIQNGTSITLGNITSDRGLAGNLTLGTGTTSNGSLTMGGTAKKLTVNGNLIVGGNTTSGTSTLTLSTNASSAGIEIGGDWTRNTTGTFTVNGRGVFFIGSGNSVITTNMTAQIPYLFIQKSVNTATVTLNNSLEITTTLGLTKGILVTTATNTVYVTNNATGAVTGGSADSYVSGPLKRANGTSGEYKFPVGVGTTYLPCSVTNPSASSNITAQAFASGSGGSLAGYDISATEYWKITADASATGTVSLARTTVSPYTSVATCSTVNGSYTNLNGSIASTLITSNTIAAGSSSNVNTSTYYAFSKVTSTIYYYKSNGDVTWTSNNNWLVSTDGTNYGTTSTAPSAVSVYQVIVQSGNTLSISSTATTPVSANFIVNGTLQLQSGGSVSTAPTYGASSLLKYNDSGTRSVGTEWSTFTDTSNATDANVPTAAGVGNPANVEVASGTINETLTSSYDKHLFIADDFVIKAGATMSFDMRDVHVTSGWATKGLIVGDSIINYGTVSTTTDSHQAYKCGTFVNQTTGTWTLSTTAVGNDIYTSGDFMNWNCTYNSVNFNGRALIFYGSKNPQTIGGCASQPLYEIDYVIIAKDAGTLAVSEKNLYCSGYANGQAGGGAITVSSGILDLSGRTVQIADNQVNNFSTITTGTTGYLRTNSGTKLYILGNETTKNTGTLRFDQTTPGTTNVIGVFRLNRSNAQAQLNVLNDFVVRDSLKIEQGKLNSSANIQLDSTATATLSSASSTTAALTVKDLIFTRSLTKSAEFYKNSGALTISGIVRTKVHFTRQGKWNFISFPYAATLKKSDGTTAATIGSGSSGGSCAVYWYDPAKRANNVSGWTQFTGSSLEKDKGYIIAKRPDGVESDLVLYFDGSVNGSDPMFNSSASRTLTYTNSTICTCNSGWNFIAHSLSASAVPSLTNGMFAYNYDPTPDTYKLWYYDNNKGYSYTYSAGESTGFKPFTAFFVKTPDASTVTLTYAGYKNPQGVMRKAPAQTQTLEETIPLYLNVNNVQYETLVRVMPDATADQDEMYDAPYNTPMSSATPRLYTLIGGVQYALNSVPEGSTIPVGLRIPAAGAYSFTWVSPVDGTQATLTDTQTGTVTDMTSNSSYDFETTASGDNNTRFVINILKRVSTNVDVTNNSPFTIRTENNKITVQGISAPAKVALYDVTGKLIQMQSVNVSQADFHVLTTGVYLLQISDKNGNNRLKVIVR